MLPSTTYLRRALLIGTLAGFMSVACSSESGPEVVSVEVEELLVTPSCVSLAAGERVVSVAPEGQVWLSTEDGVARIVEIDGTSVTSDLSLEGVQSAQAWNQQSLTLALEGELWSQDELGRTHIPIPPEVGAVEQFCGDPSQDRATFVLSDGGLFERASGFWWQWRPPGMDSFGELQRLVRIDGACADKRDAVWLLTKAGQLWQVAIDDAQIIAGENEPVSEIAAVQGLGAAVLSGGELTLVNNKTKVEFTRGEVQTIGGGGELLWAVVTDVLHVRDRDGWRRIEAGKTVRPAVVYGHAAQGAWVQYADELCHVSVMSPLRLSGVRPFEHRLLSTATVQVRTDEDEVALEIDDTEIARKNTGGGTADFGEIDLGSAGWHRLTVRGSSGATQREIEYYLVDVPQVSWQADIAPLYAANCSGAFCHGPEPEGTRVDLNSYEAWVARAPLIRSRVLRGEMPPTNPLPTDTTTVILEWIEGGMKP